MEETGIVEVVRNGKVESRHRIHGLVAGPDGEESTIGRADLVTYWRSSMKPFQALPLAEDGALEALGISPGELALCCASHAGAALHVEGVAAFLDRLGLDETHLVCGPHRPFDEASAREVLRAGGDYSRLHNNCSGKHAGMLALAVHHGWPTEGYEAPAHPVQRRIREELRRWLDADSDGMHWGTDGCGVPTLHLSLRQMARAFRRLARARREGGAAAAVVEAMRRHPELVSGPGRPATRIMEETGGTVVVKEGAEGVFCAASPEGEWGLAVKVADGARRAAAPAALAMLSATQRLTGPQTERLADLRSPAIRNTRDETVGGIRARVSPRRTAARGTA